LENRYIQYHRWVTRQTSPNGGGRATEDVYRFSLSELLASGSCAGPGRRMTPPSCSQSAEVGQARTVWRRRLKRSNSTAMSDHVGW